MATAPSLFGANPEDIQQQRAAALNAEALQYAQLDPFQRATMGIYKGASQLGGAIGGMLGGQDPQMQRASQRQQLLQGLNPNDPASLKQGIERAMSANDYPAAQEFTTRLQNLQKGIAEIEAQKALTLQRGRESRPAVPTELQKAQRLALLQTAIPQATASGNTEEAKLLEDEYKALTAPPPETRSEFERILGSLELPAAQVKDIKNQWVKAKLNPDSSGFKGLQAQLVGLQVQTAQQKLDDLKTKNEENKVKSISSLAGTEGTLDTVMTTAERALGLAPGGIVGAVGQSIGAAIPWTDAKALKNLVGSLNSEKAIQTLEQLKSQSRTGATGFGALSEKELQLLLDQTRSLDPTDKLFKENLTVVMDKWKNLRTEIRRSRLSLQGQPPEAAGGRSAADQQALTWANANANDPRARAIKQRLGQ